MGEEEICKIVLDAAIKVHKTLGGPGLLESIYRDALMYELHLRGLNVSKEQPVKITYEGIQIGEPLRLDILVENKIIIECKATEKHNPIFCAQLLTYLRLMNLHLGLLINFGQETIRDGFKRVINGYTPR